MLHINFRNIAIIVFVEKIFWILVIKNFKKTMSKIVFEVILSPTVVDNGQKFTQ